MSVRTADCNQTSPLALQVMKLEYHAYSLSLAVLAFAI